MKNFGGQVPPVPPPRFLRPCASTLFVHGVHTTEVKFPIFPLRGCAKRRSGGFPPQHDFYERGRWSFGDPNSQYSITGGSQPGFDEDGLPVEVGTNYGSGMYGVQGREDQAYHNY